MIRGSRRSTLIAAGSLAGLLLPLGGCGSASSASQLPASTVAPSRGGTTPTGGASNAAVQAAAGTEPQHIQVQHVLVGFTGSVPGKNITRSKDDARTLAYDILKKAQDGADFDALVRQYTDDSPPGIYGMANRGVQPAQGEFARDGMVPAFGNVGFGLKVGAYGIADYDAKASPFGYHVIKRLK